MKKLLCVILLSLLLVPGMAQAKRHGGHDDCRFIATADNDGTGDNRTKKRGGNYIAIELKTLESDDTLKVTPTSGSFRYVTLHSRYNGGYWNTIYQGSITEFPVSQYLAKYKADPNCTHVIVTVNGAHEKYEPIACRADVTVCEKERGRRHDFGKRDKPDLRDCDKAGSVYNDGRGDNRSKKLGGNYAAIDIKDLNEGQTLKIVPTSGNYRYITLHARYNGGYWNTIYQGPNTEFPVKEYFAKYKKDPNCTHVNVSVNGAHERYEPMACNVDFYICGKAAPTFTPPVIGRDCEKGGSVFNDGTGDNRTKKRGGNYAAINIRDLNEGQTLKIVPTSGNYRYITLHARYNGGYWNTIYQGPNTEFPVAQYFEKIKKDPNCTHVNVSVNGAHERYEPVACNVDFYICGKAASSHVSPWNHRRPSYKERKVALKALAGQHVCADGGGGKGLAANRGQIKEWETFTMVMMPGDKVAFRAQKGQYFRVMETNWNHVNAVSSSIGERETFTMIQRPGGNVAFKAFNGKYVCAEGGGGPLYANRDAASTWETFTLIYLD